MLATSEPVRGYCPREHVFMINPEIFLVKQAPIAVVMYNKSMPTIPARVPEKGFYYHYKHDPAGSVNNYAYEVMGTGCHTEDDCRPEDANLVVYRPLYESSVYKAGKLFDIRPLGMFMENVTKDGKTFPRFEKITDAAVIAELETIKRATYA